MIKEDYDILRHTSDLTRKELFTVIEKRVQYQDQLLVSALLLRMSFFASTRSFRLNNPTTALHDRDPPVLFLQQSMSLSTMSQKPPPHSSHPDFFHLVLLVFEAVLEVVCVSLPGYIVARQGMFSAEMQKFAANLNVMLFTPCLSKLQHPHFVLS